MEGYIKLHRRITENEFYFSDRFTKTHAWIDLLLLATHKATTVFIRGIEINLQPGDLCYAEKTLAKRWKWNRRTVDKFLQMLHKREMIHIKKSRITTLISINNWKLYQQSTQQSAQQSSNRVHTNKNVKEGKEKSTLTFAQKHFATPNNQFLKESESKVGT